MDVPIYKEHDPIDDDQKFDYHQALVEKENDCEEDYIKELLEKIFSYYKDGEYNLLLDSLSFLIKYDDSAEYDLAIYNDLLFFQFLLTEIFQIYHKKVVSTMTSAILHLMTKTENSVEYFEDHEFVENLISYANDNNCYCHQYFVIILINLYKYTENKELKGHIKSNFHLQSFFVAFDQSFEFEFIPVMMSYAVKLSTSLTSKEHLKSFIQLCSILKDEYSESGKIIRQIGTILTNICTEDEFDVYYFMDSGMLDFVKNQIQYNSLVKSEFYYLEINLIRYHDRMSFEYRIPCKDIISSNEKDAVAAAAFLAHYSKLEYVSLVLWEDNLVQFLYAHFDMLTTNVKYQTARIICHAILYGTQIFLSQLVLHQKNFLKPLQDLIEYETEDGFEELLQALDSLFSKLSSIPNKESYQMLRSAFENEFLPHFEEDLTGYSPKIDNDVQSFLSNYYPTFG